ncbi:MAG: flagellar motor switch protein FliN [Thermoguttaceae bacterium]
MSDDNLLDQNEIERLLSGGGAGSSSAPTPPTPAEHESNMLDQSSLDALLSGLTGASGTPPSSSAPKESEPEPDAGALAQDEIESLLRGLGATTHDPAPIQQPTTPPKSGFTSPAQQGAGATPSSPSFAPLSSFTNANQNTQGTQSSLNTQNPQTHSGFAQGLGNSPASVPPAWSAPLQSPTTSVPQSASPQLNQSRAGNVPLERLAVPTTVSADEAGVPQGDIDYLLRRAEEALESISTNKMDLPTEVVEFQFPEFGGSVPNAEHATLDQISEVELDIKIELGRTNMYLEDVLKLRKGAVVPLDKMAGEAVDVYVNGRLLARGEILVMNENFCVRIGELLAGAIPLE